MSQSELIYLLHTNRETVSALRDPSHCRFMQTGSSRNKDGWSVSHREKELIYESNETPSEARSEQRERIRTESTNRAET